MSQVQPGRQGGQRSAAGNRRPPSAKPKPGQGAAGRPAQGRGGKGGGAGRPPARPVAARPGRFSPSTMAFVAVAVVVLVVVVFVVVKISTGSSKSTTGTTAPTDVPAPASLVHEVTSLPATVFQAVGVPSSVQSPQLAKNQPPLMSGGKPEALYIGAEFCPYCAAERWAMVIAFSRFGTFSGLKETTSSPWDVYPQTATFSFHGATYSSDFLQFTPIEHETNDTTAVDTHTVLQALTSQQQSLWSKYSAMFGQQTGYPFLDIGNKVLVLGPAYSPSILAGYNQSAIAAKLSNPDDPVTQAIVGEANYISAAVCSITNQQPGPVCSASGTTEAAKAIGLS